MSYTFINAHMDTSEHGLSRYFKGLGSVANGLIGIQNSLKSVSSFAIGDEYARVFNCPTHKNLNN
jgi:hypothetical protein